MPLLIDGHNLIGQMKDISLTDPNDEHKLVGRLQGYYSRTRQPITVVFDPGDLPGVGKAPQAPGVTVVYASSSEDADAVLIRRIERDKAPRQLTVVSSDHRVAGAAKARGAQVIRAQDFARTLDEMLNPTREAARDDKPAASSADVDYWLNIFKEPPKKKGKRRGN